MSNGIPQVVHTVNGALCARGVAQYSYDDLLLTGSVYPYQYSSFWLNPQASLTASIQEPTAPVPSLPFVKRFVTTFQSGNGNWVRPSSSGSYLMNPGEAQSFQYIPATRKWETMDSKALVPRYADGSSIVGGYPYPSSAQTGVSVAVSHDGLYIAAGGWKDVWVNPTDGVSHYSGAVWVWGRDITTLEWKLMKCIDTNENKLTRVNGDDVAPNVGPLNFGYSLAFSSDSTRLFIGAPNIDENTTATGAVYCYARDDFKFGWEYFYTLYPPTTDANAAPGMCFGQKIVVSKNGSVMCIGAPKAVSSRTGGSSGAVYAYFIATESQNFINANITTLHGGSTSASMYESFGQEISVTGNGTYIFVGAPGYGSASDGDQNTMNGRAYIFTFNVGTATWTDLDDGVDPIRMDSLPGISATAAQLGYSIAADKDGSMVMISAANHGHIDNAPNSLGRGAVWTCAHKCNSTYPTLSWSSSDAMMMSPTVIPASQLGGNPYPNTWAQTPHFGSSMCLSGDGTVLAIGANGDTNWVTPATTDIADPPDSGVIIRRGIVYIYKRIQGVWYLLHSFQNVDADNDGDMGFGTSLAMSDDGSVLAVGGPLTQNGYGAIWIYN